jgi:hypothetical protein
LSTSRFHVAQLPFCCGEVWISCPILMSLVRIKFISLVASGILATSVSYCLSNEASTALHRVSLWVGPTGAIPKASSPEHGSPSFSSSTTLLWVGSRLTFTTNEHSASFANQSNPYLNPPNSSYDSLLHTTRNQQNATSPTSLRNPLAVSTAPELSPPTNRTRVITLQLSELTHCSLPHSTNPTLELLGILPVSSYITSAPTAQKIQLYCCARNIAPWTSHVTPRQYCWSVTSCACVEVCLPSRNLETDHVTQLFQRWYVYSVETADSVCQPFMHGANT